MVKDFERKLPKSGTVKAINVFELEAKLCEIAGALHFSKNKTAFADGLAISRSTVNDAIEKNACTPEFLDQIWTAIRSKGFRFSPPPKKVTADEQVWVEWRDPRASPSTPRDRRNDTVEKLMERFWQENPPKEGFSSRKHMVEAKSVVSEAQRLVPTRAISPVDRVPTPLIPTDRGRDPQPTTLFDASTGNDLDELCLHDLPDVVLSLNEVLGNASLYLPAQRIHAGADDHISATVRCHAATLEGLKLVVTCCTLTLRRLPPNPRTGLPDRKIPVQLTNAAGVAITIERIASRQTPKVRIQSSKGPIGELELPAEIWSLLDAKEGDEFECEMRIFLRDCAVVAGEDDASLARITGAPIEDTAMEKIRKRFEERALSEDGSAILHVARVKLVAVPSPKG